MTSRELDVVLVNMPFAEMQRPSLALGILSAILRSNGIRTRTFEGQLLMLEHVSFEDYFHISRSPDWYQLGEWIFSAPAFPEMNGSGDGFVALALGEGRRERVRFFLGHTEESLREKLAALRASAAAFVDALADEILATGAPVVGCSSTFQQHVASLALLRRLKQKRPGIVTMLGGGNCEGEMGANTHRHFPFVDYVISGEADDLITPLVKSLLEHGAALPSGELPEGVFAPRHRTSGYPKLEGADGSAAKYPRATIPSMDAVPTPDYDDYFETLRSSTRLREEIVPALPIENSRGCYWGKCRFCGLNGEMGGQRIKSVDRILEDVSALTTRHGIDKLEVVDNILHPRHVPDLLKSLARRRGKYSIFYEVKSSLNRDTLRLLAAAGARWLQAGVESLDDRTLALMDKGSTLLQNVQYLKWSAQYGIRNVWNLLYGFPGEDDAWYDDMAELIPLLHHLEPPGGAFPIMFCRFAEYQRNPEQYGLDLEVYPFYEYVYPLKKDEVEGLAYYFRDVETARMAASPLLSMDSRLGVARVKREIRRWRELYHDHDRGRPELLVITTRPTIQILDTRPAATASLHTLDEAQSAIHELCDAAANIETLRKAAAESGVSSEAFDAALGELVARKLVLRTGSRVVALANEHPRRGEAPLADYPMGYWRGALSPEC